VVLSVAMQFIQSSLSTDPETMAYPGILFVGGSTNSIEDRGQRDLGAVAP